MDYYLLLGHSDAPSEPVELSPEAATQASAIAARLSVIDGQIVTALQDSFVTELGDIELDYAKHIEQLREEGTRMIWALSMVTGIELKYDKYAGQRRKAAPLSYIYAPL